MAVRIDELPAALAALLGHALPAMVGGKTEQLTVQQLADLILPIIRGDAAPGFDTLGEVEDFITALYNDQQTFLKFSDAQTLTQAQRLRALANVLGLSYGDAQALTSGQRLQGLANLLALGYGDAQALTQAQKGQALANIGADWEQVGAKVTATALTQIVWTDLAPFSELWLLIWGACSTGNNSLVAQLSANNGASFITGTYAYRASRAHQTAITSSNTVANQSNFQFSQGTNTNLVDARMLITRFNKAMAQKILVDCEYFDFTSNDMVEERRSGYEVTANAKNALRLAPLGGTFTGQAVLYGKRG